VGDAIIWDIATQREITQIDIGGYSLLYGYSPDSQLFYTYDLRSDKQKGIIEIWQISTGIKVLRKEVNSISTVAFTPDSKYLVTAGSEIQLWDIASRKEVARLAYDERNVSIV
jgi:WD40 repeat protein